MIPPRTYSLEEIERALSQKLLRVRAPNGNFWLARRNGATKTWVTRPGNYTIPLKYGFNKHATISHADFVGRPGDGPSAYFLINSMCEV